MKSFRSILLAGLLSLIAGIIVTVIASAALPCYSDRAGCAGMDAGFRLFLVPVEAIAVMVILAIAASAGQRAVKLAMIMMVGLAVAGALLAWFSETMSGGRTNQTIVETAQVLIPVIVVVLVQWLVFRARMNKEAREAEASTAENAAGGRGDRIN